MKRTYLSIIICALFVWALPSHACTTVIVSGKVTSDGRPLMMKHRDTGELNNRLAYFIGDRFNYVGIINSQAPQDGVWSGTNSAGFCIMNAASYNLNDNSVPASMMDKEGILMARALGECATVDDFEYLLIRLGTPLYVEANFGVIDANGGAAYFQTGNYGWVRTDVDSLPEGYMVMTNFSPSGDSGRIRGYERYLTANHQMQRIPKDETGRFLVGGHVTLENLLSRSYYNASENIDYQSLVENPTSYHDFIPRKITSSVLIFEGVKKGEDPAATVMWTMLGYPSASVMFPVMVSDRDIIPSWMKSEKSRGNSLLCDKSLIYKEKLAFSNYSEDILDMSRIVMDLLPCCRALEQQINESFYRIHELRRKHIIPQWLFIRLYQKSMNRHFESFCSQMDSRIGS